VIALPNGGRIDLRDPVTGRLRRTIATGTNEVGDIAVAGDTVVAPAGYAGATFACLRRSARVRGILSRLGDEPACDSGGCRSY
jgi:hypothetical protein